MPERRRPCSGTTRCHRWKTLCFGSSTLPGTAVRNTWGLLPTTFIGSRTCCWTSCCWCRSWSYLWRGRPKKCSAACSAGVVAAAEISPRRQQWGKKSNDNNKHLNNTVDSQSLEVWVVKKLRGIKNQSTAVLWRLEDNF